MKTLTPQKQSIACLRLLMGFLLVLLATPAVANIFLIETVPGHDPMDIRPFIDLKIKDDKGAVKNVKTLIDTGAGVNLLIGKAKSDSELKLTGGTAGMIVGVGGTVAITTGASLAGRDASVDKVTVPMAQATKTPALPGTVDIVPLPNRGTPATPAPGEGTIGSVFLNNFAVQGGVRNAMGKGFFQLIARDQYDTPEKAKAANEFVLSFLFPTPPPKGPDGRPADTKTKPVTPTPKKTSNPQEFDNGWDIGVLLANIGTGSMANTSFVIESGSELTLISESLASLLGLPTSGLPTELIDINGAELAIPFVTTVALDVFDTADSADLLPKVGIIPTAYNPYDINILGSDFLSRYGYWGIDTIANEFFASALVPLPNTLALCCIGMAGLWVLRRKPRNVMRTGFKV